MILFLLAAFAADVILPQVTVDSKPDYPEEAKRRGLNGAVVVEVDVDVEGNVTEARIANGVHPLINEPALEAAKGLKFSPATEDGTPIPVSIQYRYVFNLASSEDGGIPRPSTLHGEIADGDGLPIPTAVVTLKRVDGTGEVITREAGGNGHFNVPFLEPGTWLVQVDKNGFTAAEYEVELNPGETLTSAFTLSPEDALEVVVYAKRQTWREVDRGPVVADDSTVTGVYSLTRRDIESTPGSLEDVTRAAHALPGVVSDGDFLAGFHVRGGEQSEVVYLLDRVPLENPFHLAGFNSLFNPDMIDGVKFYSGAAPAEVPSATSAVMDVSSWDGAPREPGRGLDGAIDLSASSARLMLMGPIDKKERFTFALAARRTYLEGYLAVLKLANIIDSAFAAPEFSELSGRAAWRPNSRHRLLFTALQSNDSMKIIDSEDESVINIAGAFELKNSLSLFSLDYRYQHNGLTWQSTAAYTRDKSFQRRDLAGLVERTNLLKRSFVRTDFVIPFTPWAILKMGGDASLFQLESQGEIEDNRSLPSWTQAGIADFGFGLADVVNNPRPWAEANVYVSTEIEAPIGGAVERGGRTLQPAVKLRAGVRGQYAGLTGEFLASPRAGIAVPLPTGTIPKASVGLYQHVIRDPVQLAEGYGNPDLRAERARHIVVGVDQAIPLPGQGTGGMLRVEAYRIDLTDLIVTPDDPDTIAAGNTHENAGSGRSQGIDVMAVARMGRFNSQLTYGFLHALRTNPLNTNYEQLIRPPQDQRHTLSIAADFQLHAHWRVTARYAFHPGRPVSQVEVGDAAQGTLALSCLNCSTLGPTHNFDTRIEWRRAYRRYRLTFYLELLNVGNIKSQFLPIHDVIDGEVSTTMLNHLPMRPFLGLRADF